MAENGYAIIPDFLEATLARELLAESDEASEGDEFVSAAVGKGEEKQVAGKIRSDEIRWLSAESLSVPQTCYWEQMEALRLALNRALYLGLFELEAHLARFPPGGFYKAHLDSHRKTNVRLLSTIIYLDEAWSESDGGQLRLYTDRESGIHGASIDIYPEAGKLVIFTSPEFWHEVRMASRLRHSLTGWFRGR